MDLSMEDVDPTMAKNIVTAARERLSENMQNIMKSSQKKTLETTLSNITEQEKALQQLNDSLMTLKKKYGIYDSNTQGEVYAEMLTSTSSLGYLKSYLLQKKDIKDSRVVMILHLQHYI